MRIQRIEKLVIRTGFNFMQKPSEIMRYEQLSSLLHASAVWNVTVVVSIIPLFRTNCDGTAIVGVVRVHA